MNTKNKRPPEPLTQDEVRALLKVCSRRGLAGRRNAALIAVLWRAGLRIHEALALTPKDVDLARGTIRVLHGKGDESRTVGLDPEACALVERWMEKRRELGANGRGKQPLFCSITKGKIGAPIYASYVRTALHRLAAKAGIEKPVRPHGLRHTLASELVREGVNLSKIQAQLGHASAATTDRYLRKIAPEELVETMRSRPAWTERTDERVATIRLGQQARSKA